MFNGDPKLYLCADGSYIRFSSGQPVMDAGLENLVMISLFSGKGWVGNYLFDDPNQTIGSDFEEAVNQPITLNSLNRIRSAAVKALNNPAFGNVTVNVSNPAGHQINVSIRIEPPGQDSKELLLKKNGLNWYFQAQKTDTPDPYSTLNSLNCNDIAIKMFTENSIEKSAVVLDDAVNNEWSDY